MMQHQQRRPQRVPLKGDFRVRTGHDFEIGEIWRVVWPEPASEGKRKRHTITGHYEETPIYENIYMFIVIGNTRQHFQGVRMFTYGGRGSGKASVSVDDMNHSPIYWTYSELEADIPLPQDTGFLLPPIQGIVNNPELGQLDVNTLVCFDKFYPIEKNILLQHVGKVHTNSMAMLHKCVYTGVSKVFGLGPEYPVCCTEAKGDAAANNPASTLASSSWLNEHSTAQARIYMTVWGTDGYMEETDRTFYRRPRHWFKPGMVIQTITANTSHPEEDGTEIIRRWVNGLPDIQKPHNFLVFSVGRDRCYALRISTKKGEGICGIPEADAAKHCRAFSGREPEALTAAETVCSQRRKLAGKVRFKMDDPAQKMLPTSTVDFSRIYEISLNMKTRQWAFIYPSYRARCLDHVLRLGLGLADPVRDDRVRQAAKGPKASAGSDEQDRETDEPVSAAGWSATRVQSQYGWNDEVILFVNRPPESYELGIREARIKAARSVMTPDGWAWEYSLMNKNGKGDYLAGAWFGEHLLMRYL